MNDLRYALRLLRRSPGFTLVAVLTLALGIGANTAIFSVLDAVLLRALPYRNPERLVVVSEHHATLFPQLQVQRGAFVSGAAFLDWRRQNQVFERMAAWERAASRLVLTGAGDPVELRAAEVTADLFPLLGVAPLLGRVFLPEEDRPGGPPVVLLGYSLWQGTFGADRNLVGRALTLDGKPYTVTGILPVGFAFPYAADVWLPLAIGSRDGDEYRAQRNFSAIARMKPGVTLARAQSDMDTIAARLVQAYAAFHRGWNVRVVPLGEFFLGQTRPGFLALAGAVVFVLMIACANVANLLLVRGAARRREMAIRTALGAGRRRLVRQMLTEGTLLAMAGAGAGLLLAVWGLEYLSSMLPAQAPAPRRLEIDGRVLVFTLGLSLLTGLVIGLFPALQISSWAQNAGRTGSPGKQRFRNALVVTQIALALVLLAGAALMIETLVRLRQIDPGFHPENRLTARVSLPYFRYADPQSRIRFFRQLLDSIEQLPGVRSAGGVFPLPFSDERQSIGFTIEGNPPSPPDQQPYANFRAVTPGYFRSMGIQLREGRLFTAADTPETERVAIVNETMAHTFWPDEDPIGRRMIIQSGVRVPSRIVGVVGDVRHAGLDAASGPEYYVPYFQRSQYTTLFLVIHSGSDPAQLAGAIRSQVRALDPEQPLADVRAMENLVGASLAPRRFYLLLLGLFSGLALLLAAIGIYGVASYSAAQRTHEIGIRMALGAEPSRMLRLVLRQGAVLAASGVALGLALAAALTRVLATLLYGISATDPRIFAAVASILMLVALAACYLPARRATRIAPMEALRYE